jgi:hypothetical protein
VRIFAPSCISSMPSRIAASTQPPSLTPPEADTKQPSTGAISAVAESAPLCSRSTFRCS